MKYLKNFESKSNLEKDINYLSSKLSYQSVDYVKETIEYYKMSDEQIHNLKLAVEYGYLYYEDYRNVVGQVINSKSESDRVWLYRESERKFKDAYESNFKNKIIKIKKPYPIARYINYKLDDINGLNSFNLYDVIGKIPTKFGNKYLAGKGRYRNDKTDKTLWEEFKNTKRESEFIRVYNESELVLLTDKDIEYLQLKEKTDKYNL